MLRIASTVWGAMLPLPALAAGGFEDASIQTMWLLWLAGYSAIAVPAAGVGFVLGTFLRLSISILVLVVLAVVPICWVWAGRGFERAAELAPTIFATLLILSPVIYAGWHFGRRDAIRHLARKSSLQNGN